MNRRLVWIHAMVYGGARLTPITIASLMNTALRQVGKFQGPNRFLANQSGSTCTLPSLPPLRMENDSIVSLLPSLYQDVTAFADLNVNVKHDGARAGVCISQCNACNNALNMGAEVRGCRYASMPCPVYGCLSTLCACTLVLK